MKKLLCKKCGIMKTCAHFRADTRMKSGYVSRCFECDSRISSGYQRKNYDPAKARVYAIKRRESGKAAENFRKLVAKFPERFKARYKLRNAVRSGKIVKKPCEECGAIKVEAHHTDYSKPFDVRWLCSKHHKMVHRKYITPNEKSNL